MFDSFPPTPFQYVQDDLTSGGVLLRDIAAAVGTPCYVYDADRALRNLSRVRAAFPDADIHYSLKANANLALLRRLFAAGAGADCVSGGEVFRALKAGASPEQIVFAGVGKTEDELRYALETGVGWINVESGQELARLERLAAEAGTQPRVALRLNPDVRADTHHYIATGHAAAKFGISLEEARHILSLPHPSVDIAGLHVHIGSQLGTAQRTADALRAILPLFEEHPSLTALDLGGGFPVSYTGEPVPPVSDFAAAVLPLLSGKVIRLLLEPGRYIVADCGALIVEVQYVKESPEGPILVTDGGMTELIRPALYSAKHDVLPLRRSDASGSRSHVVGPVCESADVLRTDIDLPPVAPGDLLAVLHAGAYGAVMGSTYNARRRPPEVLIEGGTWHVVRRRETWDDLIALEIEANE